MALDSGSRQVQCPKCGTPNDPNRVDCVQCRYLLTAPPPKTETVHQAPEPAAEVPSPSTPTGGFAPPPRKTRGIWIGVAVAALAAGGLVHLSRGITSSQPTAAAPPAHSSPAPSTAPPATKPSTTPSQPTTHVTKTPAHTATPASQPSSAKALPMAVAADPVVISGTVNKVDGGVVVFPATLVTEAGARHGVTVYIDTGNGNMDGITNSLAQQIGLLVTGQSGEIGVNGTDQQQPVYQGFSLIPQAHYVVGSVTALNVPKVIGMGDGVGPGGSQPAVNLGQASLNQGVNFYEAAGQWWVGWQGPATVTPPTSPPPRAQSEGLPLASAATAYAPMSMSASITAYRKGPRTTAYSSLIPIPAEQLAHIQGLQAGYSGWYYIGKAYTSDGWGWIYAPKNPKQTQMSYALKPGQPPIAPWHP